MLSVSPVGFSTGETKGESNREQFTSVALKQYEFAIGKEVVAEGIYGDMKIHLAPLKCSILPMTNFPLLSK